MWKGSVQSTKTGVLPEAMVLRKGIRSIILSFTPVKGQIVKFKWHSSFANSAISEQMIGM